MESMMDTPVDFPVLDGPSLESSPRSPLPKLKEGELPYDKQKVFFATDRVRDKRDLSKLAYTADIQKQLETGWTYVSIPKKWENGLLRRPGEAGKPAIDDTSEKAATHHIILLPGPGEHQSFSQETDFYRELHENIANRKPEHRELLLFIHGYNTPFKQAIRTGGQVAFDLKHDPGNYDGAVLVYDWASFGDIAQYVNDQKRALETAVRLAVLLENLADKLPKETKLHIVAHSLGNDVLKNAIDDLFQTSRLAAMHAMTHTVTFAAPAVARGEFMNMVTRLKPGAGQQPVATLLCSSDDVALWLANSFDLRAGLFEIMHPDHKRHPVFMDILDTIDASGFRSFVDIFGHGYYSNSGKVLAEISRIINTRFRAARRITPSTLTVERQRGGCKDCLEWYKIIH